MTVSDCLCVKLIGKRRGSRRHPKESVFSINTLQTNLIFVYFLVLDVLLGNSSLQNSLMFCITHVIMSISKHFSTTPRSPEATNLSKIQEKSSWYIGLHCSQTNSEYLTQAVQSEDFYLALKLKVCGLLPTTFHVTAYSGFSLFCYTLQYLELFCCERQCLKGSCIGLKACFCQTVVVDAGHGDRYICVAASQ